MILVKAPLRLSFFGGGSDIPTHFLAHGGTTLSATFDKFVYVSLMRTPQPHIKVAYSSTQYATTLEDVKHDIVREALREYKISSHLEISSFADIPTVGTGLGASSAFTVALVAGLERLTQPPTAQSIPSPYHLVRQAAKIELDRVKSPIGYQDHIAAAYGGLLLAEYFPQKNNPDNPFAVQRLFTRVSSPTIFDCLFWVKMPERQVSANVILSEGMQSAQVQRLAEIAKHAKNCVQQNHIRDFGELLHACWQLKKQANPNITTPEIDAVYQRSIDAGVLGGKLLGAGGGGYLLLCAQTPEHKAELQRDIFANDQWYNVALTPAGAEVVYDDTRES